MTALKEVEKYYKDKPEIHQHIWNLFLEETQKDPLLRIHRDHIEANQLGYGDRPLHYMWKLLVQELGRDFNFLEIGVFKGQVISLVKVLEPTAKIYGVTPLNSTGDKYATHPELDYLSDIKNLHRHYQLPAPTLYNGTSYDPRIQFLAKERQYSLMLIDGCHDFEVVLDDLREYAPLVKLGGYLVVDDAATDLNIPKDMLPGDFRGLQDVTKALNLYMDVLTPPGAFKHVLAVGHNRVYRRVS